MNMFPCDNNKAICVTGGYNKWYSYKDDLYFLNLDSLEWTRYEVPGIGRIYSSCSLVRKEKMEKYTTQVYFIEGKINGWIGDDNSLVNNI